MPCLNQDPALAEEFRAGARALAGEYLGLREGDRLLLSYEANGTVREAGTGFDAMAEALAGEAAGLGILCEVSSSEVPFEALASRFEGLDAVLFVSGPHLLYRDGIKRHFASTEGRAGTPRFYQLPFCYPSVVRSGFRVPPSRIRRVNEALIRRMRDAAVVRVASRLGTDLRIRLRRDQPWESNAGESRPGMRATFPPGEVATFSEALDGVAVVDGALNPNFEFPADVRLAGRHLTVRFEQGRAAGVECADPVVREAVRFFLEKAPNADRVGEIGFGTNEGIREFIPHPSFLNERFPALHLGLGQALPGFGASWSSPVHMDLILGECEIYLDDALVLEGGRYRL